jgi:hypothetical protein
MLPSRNTKGSFVMPEFIKIEKKNNNLTGGQLPPQHSSKIHEITHM